MKTPKELAQELAEGLVVIKRPGASDRSLEVCGYDVRPKNNNNLEAIKRCIIDVLSMNIEQRINTALTQCPVPGADMNQFELENLVASIETLEDSDLNIPYMLRIESALEIIRKLKAHIDFIHYVMKGPEAEDYTAAYDVGYNKGYAEGLKEGYDKAFNDYDADTMKRTRKYWKLGRLEYKPEWLIWL